MSGAKGEVTNGDIPPTYPSISFDLWPLICELYKLSYKHEVSSEEFFEMNKSGDGRSLRRFEVDMHDGGKASEQSAGSKASSIASSIASSTNSMFHSANSDVSEREHSRGGGGAPAAIFAPASYKNMA
jgi:hypothetical protein